MWHLHYVPSVNWSPIFYCLSWLGYICLCRLSCLNCTLSMLGQESGMLCLWGLICLNDGFGLGGTVGLWGGWMFGVAVVSYFWIWVIYKILGTIKMGILSTNIHIIKYETIHVYYPWIHYSYLSIPLIFQNICI